MNEAIRRTDPCGEYDVLQRVGGGSYGEVYKARNLRNGEFAAVKMVKLETGDNFAAIQQEIVMLKDCRHKNIISYYESYLNRDKFWIVMEYCGGGSLQDIYQMTGPLTELQIAFVCRETLQGLKYLHQRGKVHRDVKGANILLTFDGNVKLADFGIAAQITATLGKRQSFIGTPYWMAPEVANVEHSGGYGSECDIWAVGITAIELAEQKPPYFDLQPLQMLHMMTKSNYKIPKLKDKNKWSSIFVNFVRACLTKNPKKRPSPAKLLNTNPFVSGALSSRLTLELLDRVNHPERIENKTVLSTQHHHYQNEHQMHIGESEPEQENLIDLNPRNIDQFIQPVINFDDGNSSSLIPPNGPSSSSSSREYLNSTDDDEVFDQNNRIKDQSNMHQTYHSERTLLASHSSQEEKTIEGVKSEEPLKKGKMSIQVENTPIKRRPRNLLLPPLPRVQRPISSASEQPTNQTPNAKVHRFLSRIDESFRQKWSRIRSKSSSMVNIPLHISGLNAGYTNYTPNRHPQHQQPFQSRPMTCCYGVIPTPQVTMGACFVTVLQCSPIQVNCCTQWFHPANQRQFMVIGAEQGIFAMDLSGSDEESPLIQLHERRCTWLYVVQDTVTALQGKTPYLYRHELVQLFQQELITQKLVNSLDKLPEKFKPKFISSIRMPETKDCFQCTVEIGINDGNLYLCCAIPNAVLLFRWYEPLARFVCLKKVELNKLSVADKGVHNLYRPFSLIFVSTPSNSDYPIICIGISRSLTSPVGTAQELLHELRTKPKKDKLELQFVNFNENSGGIAKFHELFSSDLFGGNSSSDEENNFLHTDCLSVGSGRSPGTRTSLRTIWRWREKMEGVVALKQLDRDTLFIAYENQILITDLEGNEKKTNLKLTTQSFTFDFRLDFAIPLSDSVLAFYKHGVQGRSFFRGTITQDLNDTSHHYRLVGKDSLVVLKKTKVRKTSCQFDSLNIDGDAVLSQCADEPGEDICVLTGHVSTMTPP